MKYLNSLFFLLLYSQCIAQISSRTISEIINSPNDDLSGIYVVKEWTLYENDKIDFVSPFKDKFYIDTKSSSNAYNIKDNKTYFNIQRVGNNLTVSGGGSNGNYTNIVSQSLFNSGEFILKLLSKNDKTVYVAYTIEKVKKIEEAFSDVSQSSGIIISKDGFVITNSHAVNKSSLIQIEINGKTFDASIVYKDKETDIALLSIQKPANSPLSFVPLQFSNKSPLIGDDVLALGFPLANAMGYELKLTNGIISSLKGIKDDNTLLQFSAPVDPGNSGGPLLNNRGEIIGIISAKLSIGTNVGYAIKVEVLPEVIKRYLTKASVSNQSISKSAIYTKAKKSIVIIKSYYL